MKGVNKIIHNIARGFGFDIVRYEPKSHPLARRKKILDTYGVNLILDVGANVGQYGTELREIGFKGKIVSFEPLNLAYKELSAKAEKDDLWDVHNYALGDKEEIAQINIAGNSFSSSLLDILPSHIKSAPESEYTGKEEIEVRTLDSIFPSLSTQADRIYLKIDTQGYEESVLQGGLESLKSIDTIQLEMSLTPLYKDQLLFNEMYDLLHGYGYRLIAVEPGFTDKSTGQLLQLDGIFHRL